MFADLPYNKVFDKTGILTIKFDRMTV